MDGVAVVYVALADGGIAEPLLQRGNRGPFVPPAPVVRLYQSVHQSTLFMVSTRSSPVMNGSWIYFLFALSGVREGVRRVISF